jgi:hypothetical protein
MHTLIYLFISCILLYSPGPFNPPYSHCEYIEKKKINYYFVKEDLFSLYVELPDGGMKR